VKADVTIIGGGLAGLTLARQLTMQQPDLDVRVVERRAFPVAERTHKVGESLVELAAHYLGDVLGLREHLLTEHVPKLGLRFFFRSQRPTPIHQRLEYGVFEPPDLGADQRFAGLPVPGYQVDRGRLENHLAALVGDRLLQRTVEGVELGAGGRHRVCLEGGEAIDTRWLIDASGRRRILARQLGLGHTFDHAPQALWARVACSLRVEDWTDGPAFRSRMLRPGLRHLSTNHLVGPGYWVWLIPLPGGATSVGVMADPALAPIAPRASMASMLAFLETREPELAEALRQAPIEDVRTRRSVAYGARQIFSRDRWAMTGEAALHLDPLYSPGADFIAMGNTLITQMIAADTAGESLSGRARLSELLFQQLLDGYLEQYRGAYALMGAPRAMAHKVIWDSTLYFATHALLFRNGALGDPATLLALRPELERTRRVHTRAQAALRKWASREPGAVSGFLPHECVEPLVRLNFRLKDPVAGAALTDLLRDNLARAERYLEETLLAGADGRPYPDALRGSA